MNPPDGVNDAAMRTYIHDKVEGDLAFILQENGVPLALQYNLTQVFTQLRRFSAIADSRQGVRHLEMTFKWRRTAFKIGLQLLVL